MQATSSEGCAKPPKTIPSLIKPMLSPKSPSPSHAEVPASSLYPNPGLRIKRFPPEFFWLSEPLDFTHSITKKDILQKTFMTNRRGLIEMSEIEAGPSIKRHSIPALEFAANIEKFERLKQEVGITLSPASTSKGSDDRRPRSINGQHLPWFDVETQGWNQSPTSSGFPPQPPKKTKLYEYNKIWRSNYTLSLDGGGVRGYSQLIIIKALMDEVARIERSRPDENGNIVESSFHPFSPKNEKSITRPKLKHSRRKMKKMKKESSTNGHTNDDTKKSKGKGKEVERQSDSSISDEEEGGKFYPYHYFDYIAGTSTGGLNAIMLGRLRMNVDECLRDFPEMARRVFGKPRFASYRLSPLFWFCAKYSGNRLRDVVKEVVDEHLCEGEGYMLAMNKEMCRTVVLAMKKNLKNHETAHLFRTYDHHRRKVPKGKPMDPFEKTGPADSSLIWEVARATSAAPSYFNTIKIGEDEYGDAGFGENNPSKRLFWEVSHMNNNNDNANALSISIGTGITRFSRFQTGFLKKPIGWINAAKAVSTDCENAHLEMQNIHKHKYFRFNVPEKATDPDAQEPSKWQYIKKRTRRWIGHGGEPLDRGLGKIKLDEWKSRGWWRKESTQEEIKRITEEYLKDLEVIKELNEIAEMMVSHRRARARTDRWAAYALGIRYECPITFERCPDDTWTDERHLRRHLVEDHEIPAGNTQADEYLEQFLRAGKYFEDHH